MATSIPEPELLALAKANYGPTIVGVTATMLALSTLFMGLRLFVRARLQRHLATDDWFMIVGYIMFIVMSTFIFLGVHSGGVGRHTAILTVPVIERGLKYILFNELFYVLAVSFFKNSIAVLELRLGMGKWYGIVIWVSIGFNIASTIALFFFFLFRCNPVDRSWKFYEEGTCASMETTKAIVYFFSSLDIFFDWLYALLPIPMVLRLHMAPVMKLSVIGVLGLGVFASVATIVRVKYLGGITSTTDPNYSFNGIIVWSVMEIGLGIMTGCASTLRPLLRAMNLISSGSTNGRSSQVARSHTWGQSALSRRAHSQHHRMDDLSTMELTKGDARTQITGSTSNHDRNSEERILEGWDNQGISVTVDIGVEREHNTAPGRSTK